jgi:CBS-domain-containing membrane protein
MSVLDPGELTSVIGVSLATLLMLATRAIHPPAGIDAFLMASHALPAGWLVNPVLIGAVLLAAFARVWAIAERKLLMSLVRNASDNGTMAGRGS